MTAAEVIEQIAEDGWRADLCEYAIRASGGAWRPYRWLRWAAALVQRAAITPGSRLVLCAPPRHGKSELISRWLPCWYLDNLPDRRVILASHGASLAGYWSQKIRGYFADARSPRLSRLARRRRTKAGDEGERARQSDWELQAGGGLLAAGVGGAITGRGGDLLLLDDVVKDWQEGQSPTVRDHAWDWFVSTFLTRCEPGASVIVIATRWHKDDVIGRIERGDAGKGWQVVSLPAIAGPGDPLGRAPGEALLPERYPRAALDVIREQDLDAWAAVYQQIPGSFLTIRGRIFPELDPNRHTLRGPQLEEVEQFSRSYRLLEGWDFGSGPDAATAVVWALYVEALDLLILWDSIDVTERPYDEIAEMVGGRGYRTAKTPNGRKPYSRKGDPAGRQRDSAQKSWFANLETCGIELESAESSIFRRISTLRNAIRRGRVMVHPQAKRLMEALCSYRWKEVPADGVEHKGEPKKDWASHLADAAEYIACDVWGDSAQGSVALR